MVKVGFRARPALHRELAPRQRDRLVGLAGEQAGVEVEDEPGEPQRRCGFPRGLDAVESRSVDHDRRPSQRAEKLRRALLSLQQVYSLNISSLRACAIVIGS